MEKELLNKILEKLETIDDKFDVIDKRFDLIDDRFDAMDDRLDTMDKRMDRMDEDIQFVRGTVVRIENEHGKILGALYDGYVANYELIERLDPRVTKLERAVERIDFSLSCADIKKV